jgi:two-component system cell cycle sensor histidine kinase/response regulator CckA
MKDHRSPSRAASSKVSTKGPKELGRASGPQRLAELDDAALRKLFAAVFDGNPQPLWIYDVETLGFLAVNEAAIRHYGYSRDEFLAMTIADIRPPGDVEALKANVSRIQPGFEEAGVWRHVAKDGSRIDVEVSSHTLDFLGRPAELVLAHDVTERLRLEEQVRQSQKMEAVGRLAAGVAHDFNNLLTVIGGHGVLLQEKLDEDSEFATDIDEIVKAADRAAQLTRQLLAFSRQQVLNAQVIDLNAVVRDVARMLRRLVGEHVAFTTKLGEPLGNVRADPGQIEQVIFNLAVNARDAMPRGGTLTLETSNVILGEPYVDSHFGVRPGPYVVLAVSDTGTGMDPETQKSIFEPFFTTKPKGEGTGLGLSTVYGIVKQSGGNVWVYSEPGRGTTFKVYLPAVNAPLESTATSPTTAAPRGSETILLVEDEDSLRRLARTVLESRGYRVLAASSGPEALELLASHTGSIDLLLTDAVMPGMSGRALLHRVREAYPGMRVLVMSGYSDDAITSQGELDPGTAFLQKPFVPNMLVRKVREVLEAEVLP